MEQAIPAHPQAQLENSTLPLDKTPKSLDARFDPLFTFTLHIREVTLKYSNRLNILKALSGTLWSHQKETLPVTYNALIKPSSPMRPYVASFNLPNQIQALQVI